MGRGSSGADNKMVSRAVAIENMTEQQIDKEIRKAERAYKAAQDTIDKYSKEDSASAEMRNAFPLGTGGLSKRDAEKLVGRMAERELTRSKIVSEAIEKRSAAQSRIDSLKKAKEEIHGSGLTLKEKRKSAIKSAAQSDRKWRIVQKGGMENGGYKPRIIQSGSYEIRGSNGFFRVYGSGNIIATVTTLTEAKAAVNVYEKKKNR